MSIPAPALARPGVLENPEGELTENGARQREGRKNEFRECHGESMKKLASLKEGQLLYQVRKRRVMKGKECQW